MRVPQVLQLDMDSDSAVTPLPDGFLGSGYTDSEIPQEEGVCRSIFAEGVGGGERIGFGRVFCERLEGIALGICSEGIGVLLVVILDSLRDNILGNSAQGLVVDLPGDPLDLFGVLCEIELVEHGGIGHVA